jgi:DNA-binding beta-propeller fold protein YncE
MKLISALVAVALITTSTNQTVRAPRFEVDLLWPKPLPQHQLLGSAVGVAVDSRDHVWVINLTDSFTARTETGANANPPIGECCFPSANVLEFDPTGKLVGHWGGPGQGYTWPTANHGIAVDSKGNVWISGSGPRDTQILQFTRDGKFVKAFGTAAPAVSVAPAATTPDTTYAGVSGAGRGTAGAAAAGGARGGAGGGRGRGRGSAVPPLPANSAATDAFGGAAEVSFGARDADMFVADGYRNHRVAVVNPATGAVKRMWGAYGKAPTDSQMPVHNPQSAQFGNPVRCAEVSRGIPAMVSGTKTLSPGETPYVYVCDRANNRIQVFTTQGEFVKEKAILPATKGAGSVWDIAFSRDREQKYLYVADGQNMKVHILDRQTLEVLSSFGDGGRYPGQFTSVHSLATDSKGNIYTVESSEGKRLQKFIFKGVDNVPRDQGVTWPKKGGK